MKPEAFRLPRISVHVVTYNSQATLGLCLEALSRQDYPDFQVVIFDNASKDETCEIARSSGYRLIESDVNVGYAQAHNRLIDQTDSEYVLTLNPDVSLDPNFLDAMHHALDADLKLGSATGCLLRVEQLGDPTNVIDSAGLAMQRNRRQRLLGEGVNVADYPAKPQAIFGPDGAAAFYRRAMLDDIRVADEVFDADFFMHKEDVDVCWRAQLRGWKSLYVPEAKAYHVRGFRPGQRHDIPPHIRTLSVRNRYLLSIKNEIPAHFLRDLPFILFYDAGVIAYLLLRERESLGAFRSLWQLRRRMLQKRHLIQSRRRVDASDIARWFSA